MSDTLFFGLPLLSFLLIASLTLIVALIWNKHLSSKARARYKRINEFTQTKVKGNDLLSSLPFKKGIDSDFSDWLWRRFPWISQVELSLIRAGVDITASQFLVYSYTGFILIWASLLLFLDLSFIPSLTLSALIALLPFLYLRKLQIKRAINFEEQLPDALEFMSRALLSGNGLNSTFVMVGEEFSGPLGPEFKTTSDEINFGSSYADALHGLTNRVISSDLNFLVVSLLIQRETGGNLAELLSSLAATVRERLKIKGKVRILSSEAKLSAIILTALPIVIGLIMTAINYDFMSLLWTTKMGINLLLFTAIMIPLGVYFMWKITQIKV